MQIKVILPNDVKWFYKKTFLAQNFNRNNFNLDVYQLDVKTAFLNGVLEEEIYMEIPDGYITENNVCEITRKVLCKYK